MVTPREVLNTVKLALERSNEIEDSVNYLTHEADTSTDDVRLPLIELQPVSSIRLNPNNTDLVGYTTDGDGNRVGRLYHSEYQLTIQIDCWVADVEPREEDASDEAYRLGQEVRSALYEYTSRGPENQFLDEDERVVDEIWRVILGDGEQENDLVPDPTVRRWRQELDVWAYEVFSTNAEYIADVNYPADDLSGTIDVEV